MAPMCVGTTNSLPRSFCRLNLRCASQVSTQRGAALVELALVLTLLVGILTGMSGYLTAYRSAGEEIAVEQSLKLGRLNLVPASVLRAASGSNIFNTDHAELLGGYIRSSFVERELLAGTDDCLRSGDYRSFVLQITPQFDTDGNPVLDGNGKVVYDHDFVSGVVNCKKLTVITRAAAAGDPSLNNPVSNAKNFGQDRSARQQVLVVIFSNMFPGLPALVRDGEEMLRG